MYICINIPSSKGNSSCAKPPDYPLETYGAAGAFLDGKARYFLIWDSQSGLSNPGFAPPIPGSAAATGA